MDHIELQPPGPRQRQVYNDDESLQDAGSLRNETMFDNNDQALIDNPLLHWNPNETERKARQFAREFDLHNQEQVLIKAAKILRDPEAWKSVPHLTDDEKVALMSERNNGFWKQPKELKLTIMTLCVAAVVQGWNQTASNGANLQWPLQLGLDNLKGCQPKGPQAWIFAIVNAAPYLSASLIGCWLTDFVSETFLGRRPPIALSGTIIFASIVGSSLTQTWRQLLVCRVLLGIGMGLKASIVPVFAAEVAPAHIRGSLVMNWQLFDALGICLGFTANLVVSRVGKTMWRWQTASSVLPTIILLTLIFACPESPRFLMKHQRYKEAYKTLLLLRGERILAAKELLYIHYQTEVEMRQLGHAMADPEADDGPRLDRPGRGERPYLRRPGRGLNYYQKLRQLFTVRRIRRAMIAAVVCMVGQQMCGVNVLAFYSSTFFCDSNEGVPNDGNTSNDGFLKALFLSWGIGLCNFLFAFPAYYLIDRRGRRWLLLVALPFLALTMLAAALSFLIPSVNVARAPVIGLWVYLFMIIYSWSMGPVPFTMSAEVFPHENRVVGMSFAVFTNLFGAGLLTLFVPALTIAIGHSGLLGIFAVLNVIAFSLVFFFVRETAGAALGGTPGSMTFMSLEELNYIFAVPTAKHIRYQVTTVAPWIWKYYVRRDVKCPDRPPKLYTWASARGAREEESDDDENVEDRGQRE